MCDRACFDDALRKAERLRPDAILAAPYVHGASAVPFVSEVRVRWPDTKVVVFAARLEREQFVEFFRLGVRAYVDINEGNAEVLRQTLIAVLRHDLVVTSYAALQAFLAQQPRLPALADPPELSEAERAVLKGLACGMEPKEIAEAQNFSKRTVGRVIERLRGKFDAATNGELMVKATLHGLVP